MASQKATVPKLGDAEAIETLTQLGLTFNQARVYLALVKYGAATAKEIAKNTHITRQDIYRVMPTLQKAGLVELTLITPTKFEAIPIEQGIAMLLKRKAIEHRKLEESAQEVVHKLENYKASPAADSDSQFIIIPEKEAHLKKVKKLTGSVKKTLDIVTSHSRYSQAVEEFFPERLKALNSGAQIRVISDKPQLSDEAKRITEIEKKMGICTKYISSAPPALLLIFDKKEVLIINSATAKLADATSLWSNNPSLVAIAQHYFESLWASNEQAN
jgi:sugar-specific transcriptional regulator TrmB